MTDIPESAIQIAIENYLKSTGWKVIKFKNTGTFDPVKNIFRQHVTEKGISDIVAMKGITAWIEVKKPSERKLVERVDVNKLPLKSHLRIWNQKRFIADVIQHGCKGFFAYSIDDVMRELGGF